MNIFRYIFPVMMIIVTVSGTDGQILRNLMPNPSFEYSGRDTVRESPEDSWTFTATDETVTGHATASRAIDGFRSYLIRAETGRGLLESDIFPVDRSAEYLLSFAYSGDGFIETVVRWHSCTEKDTVIVRTDGYTPVKASDSWSIREYHVRVPRRANGASVRFIVDGGRVWIDDVRFR